MRRLVLCTEPMCGWRLAGTPSVGSALCGMCATAPGSCLSCVSVCWLEGPRNWPSVALCLFFKSTFIELEPAQAKLATPSLPPSLNLQPMCTAANPAFRPVPYHWPLCPAASCSSPQSHQQQCCRATHGSYPPHHLTHTGLMRQQQLLAGGWRVGAAAAGAADHVRCCASCASWRAAHGWVVAIRWVAPGDLAVNVLCFGCSWGGACLARAWPR